MSEKFWNDEEQRWETKWDARPYTVDGKQTSDLDLAKLFGKKSVQSVRAYLTGVGGLSVGISRINFDDGTFLLADGYHDTAYVYGGHNGPEIQFDLDSLDYDENFSMDSSGFVVVEYKD